MSDFETFGKAIDERVADMADAFKSVFSALSDALETFALPPTEAARLKDLAREHDLDAVERNSVRVERTENTLRAKYHDGTEWTHITDYRVNCRCESEVQS